MIPYLKLMRISALPTLWSNVLAAFWISASLGKTTPSLDLFGLLLLTSSMFYLAGMVLNDFFDAKIDAVERPERPIPSGRVSRHKAGWLGFSYLLLGWVGVEICFMFFTSDPTARRAGFLLMGSIVAYNTAFKHIPVLGPLTMGACRFFNILFVSAVVGFVPVPYALTVFAYVTGVTILSGFEAHSPTIQRIVGIGLAMLIPLDAAFCLYYAGPLQAGAILCLYPIALFLRRIVLMT